MRVMRNFYEEEYGVSTWLFPVALLSLFFGGIGEGALYASVAKEHFLKVIIGIVFSLPALTIYVLTYLNRPILAPRQFRFCLLCILSWYAFFAILAEVLCSIGYLPSEGPRFALRLLRITMHFGWLSFIPLGYGYIAIRRHELTKSWTSPD